MRTLGALALQGLLSWLGQGAVAAQAVVVPVHTATMATVGQIDDPLLPEVSGLAASHRHADRYWVHNDSGDGPFLYALDAHGRLQGRVQVDGVAAVDWEDIASFQLGGKAYLLIQDGGDNLRLRGEYWLHVVEEPELPADGSVGHVAVAWQLRYRYPQEVSRDTEAVAVDAAGGHVFLVPKFLEPPTLFRLPLRPQGDAVAIAQEVAPLAPPAGVDPTKKPRFRVTAMDLAPDGRHAAVLGYRHVWLYTRQGQEAWSTTFTHPPQRVTVSPPVHQPEALGFTRDGRGLMVTGEGRGQPLLRIGVP